MQLRNLKPDPSKSLPPSAISYLRFSGVRQGQGDSKRRQDASADEFTEITGIPIEEHLQDLGLSAFKGHHVSKGALGAFLEQIQSDEFQAKTAAREVYLVVENLDRLSREAIDDAFVQFRNIVKAGVTVVTMMDQQVFNATSIKDMATVITSIVTMARSHQESADKSDRLCKMWEQLRKKAEAGEIISKRLPSWLTLSKDGKRILEVPHIVAVVRRVYKLAAEGMGLSKIAKTLNAEGIPTLSLLAKKRKMTNTRTLWCPSTVRWLIDTKTTLGFYQMKKGKEVVCEIPDYYPQVVSPELRAKALKIRQTHPTNKGRTSLTTSNLFRKLAFDKKSGDPMYIHGYYNRKYPYKYLTPMGVKRGQRNGKSWRLDHFERIFLSCIELARKVKGSTDKEEDALCLLEEELSKTQKRIDNICGFIEDDDEDDPDLARTLAKRRGQKRELVAEIERLKVLVTAGAGGILLNVAEPDRDKLANSIRANVKRIDMDCETKTFWVELINGITYIVQQKGDLVQVSSDHPEIPRFLQSFEVNE